MYIATQRRTVSLYHNASVELDTQDALVKTRLTLRKSWHLTTQSFSEQYVSSGIINNMY